ncbi:alpha,alpha-trehalose-phosphate synthase (UDP-forming) [Actinomycetospora cinnamomea]|uniref:Trehalose 6-phosphate synthase n=1 Tax=Actinomycetospora cinnamomea TaxID=663609 RepID=A0A2U1FLJ8_9PSEU|nr:trehalose-6-phosphate synthase [Actinomycetospora cinnamomea]PVZ13048.1 trehalose 6-phosphate synthase [Actinomycetospora cinnamomea]
MTHAEDARGSSELVVVANRLPVDLVPSDTDGGQPEWRRSPGGLVTALEPTLRARGGTWVGWPGVADAEPEPFDDEGMGIRPVPITADELAAYYEGFANATLWPLYHDVVARPHFERSWWEVYRRVNERFADATAEVAAQDATVWVQDYQLQLVPQMLRERRPDLRIGFFLHIPFPPVELFAQLPWRRLVVEGLLGADVVGFQTVGSAENFRSVAARLTDATADDATITTNGSSGHVTAPDGRTVTVGAHPISVDSGELDAMAREDATAERATELRHRLGDPRTVLLGVDRLDYTKGIDVRLQAFAEILGDGRLDPAETVLIQVATPSRERVEHYAEMRDEIELTVGRVNGEYASVGNPVIHYVHQPVPRDELVAFYRAADVMLVTPYRDGMNLVAKEYVASRADGDGALVLSEFTGAADELAEGAFLVNPHDLDAVEDAIVEAAGLGTEEARRRMGAMREQVLHRDVERWASGFLAALGALRAPE